MDIHKGTAVASSASPPHEHARVRCRSNQETNQADRRGVTQLPPEVAFNGGVLRAQVELLEGLARNGQEDTLSRLHAVERVTLLVRVDVAHSGLFVIDLWRGGLRKRQWSGMLSSPAGVCQCLNRRLDASFLNPSLPPPLFLPASEAHSATFPL